MKSSGEPPKVDVHQTMISLAQQFPGDYQLFGALMEFSLQLTEQGRFDEALRVADEMIANTSGKSRLHSQRHGRRYGGLGKGTTDVARQAREQILAIRQDVETQGPTQPPHTGSC